MRSFFHLVSACYVVALSTACSEGSTGSGGSSGQTLTSGVTTAGITTTAVTTTAESSTGTSTVGSVGTVGTTGGASANGVGGAASGTVASSATTGMGFGGSTGSSDGGSDGAIGTTGEDGTSTGAGGAGGASSGTAGFGGDGGTLSVAESIHQFRLESPCIDGDHFGSEQPENCDVAADVDRQTYTKILGGDSNVVYDVRLRVRGITEPNTYESGTLEPPRFYVGGQTTQPGYTAYSLTVAEPSEVYFFNYNDSVGHFLLELDYEVVIPMRGATTLTFDINGQTSVPDGHGVSNRDGLVVRDVPPSPDPYNGQFIQFDVIEVRFDRGN